MQKYSLVCELQNELYNINFNDINDNCSTAVELCIIDKFTSTFRDESECIKWLYEKKYIDSLDASLHIKRPNGEVDALDVIYDDIDLKNVSIQMIRQLKTSKTSMLAQTTELKRCCSQFISFFMEKPDAVNMLEHASFYGTTFKNIVSNLKEYLKYRNQTFYEPHEISMRERSKQNIYSGLRKYELLRNLRYWTKHYHEQKHFSQSSSWGNPYERYEREKEEHEERTKNNL